MVTHLNPEITLFAMLGLGLAVAFYSAGYHYPPGALGGVAIVFLCLVVLLYLQVRSLTGRPPRGIGAVGRAYPAQGERAAPH